MEFEVYRGLNKPLLLFGFKGSYIYKAMGTAAGGVVLAGVLSSFIGLIGILIGLLISLGGIAFLIKRQDTLGLYRKTKNERTLFIYPAKMRDSRANQNQL